MNEKMYKKVNEEVAAKFKNAAAWIVDNECREFDKTPIVGVRRDNLIDTYSYDLAIGSTITKNKYLLIGGLAGVAISAGIIVTYITIKKFKKSIKKER